MVKVKKNNRNFEVKKYIKKTTPALMSLLVATSCLNGVHYPKNAYASGVTQKINTGDGGVKVLYANNGLNPLNFSIGDAATYGNKNVEDVVKITVDFPKNNGQNDYGPESKKVHIKYEFNSNKGAYWSGRPFYWFSLPKNVKEPSNIKITNAKGHSDSIQNWKQWATNTRFVASRYQNMEDAIKQNEGHPHDWGRFNDRTEEYQKGFNGSFNYQFNRMLDEQDGGWFDENGGTRNFAKSIRNNSKSIYIDWESRGDGKVTIEVETEVMFPLKSNTLDFAAGAFSVLGNIRIANMQTVTTPHYITYAEKYALDTPEIMEVENPNNIGEEKKKEIIKKLKEEPKNKDKTKYLVEENKYDDHKQQIEVKDNGDTTITFRDLSQQTIAGSRLVTKHVPYKDRFGIKIPQTTEVKKVDSLDSNEINKVKNAIYEANKDNKDFLEGIGGEAGKDSAIKVDNKGKATITYKDNSSHEIEANKLVTRYIPLAEKYEPFIYTTTPVKDLSSINETEKKEIIRKLKEINKDNTEFMNNLKDGFDKALTVDKQGNATFKYKDDSEDKIVSSRLVYKALPMNQQFSPVPGNRTAVDDDQNVKEEEKKKILEELKAANKNIFENSKLDKSKGLDNSGVEFDSKGEATFHYADGTTDTISASRLLYKKGGSTTIGTELKTNGQYKYYLTPIKIKSWEYFDKNKEGLWSDAARRFVYDNYDWDVKDKDFQIEKKKQPIEKGGGQVTHGGWLIWQKQAAKTEPFYKEKANTSNIRIAASAFGDSGISRIVQGDSDNLEFQNSNVFNNVMFKIPKTDLFYIDNPFDKEKAKKEAEQIIDDLKKKGLSEEDANKLKKELEDKKDTLTQDQVDKTIKEAEQKAKEGKEKQDLDKAKQKAQEEIGNLKDLDNKEKEKLKKEVEQKNTPEDVKKVVDKAREEDSKAKEAKDKKKLLDEAKKRAKEIIKGLQNLEKGEIDNFDKQVDSAQDENKINQIVEQAKEQDKANADKKALEEAKKKAKEIIGKLEHLSTQEKEAYTKQTAGSVDKAKTKEDVEKEIKKAQEKDADNKKALDQAKNKAKEDIGKLKHLSPEEREKYNKEIDKAKDQNGIDQVINKAKEQDKKNAKDQAIKDIKNSGLTDEEKKQAEQDINNASSTDEIDKKAEEHLKKAAEEKAKKEKEEADKLKEEYKQKIENTQGLDQKEKQDYKKQIDEASSKGQMDSIVEMAQAKAKQKQAKEEIAKLTHLNTAQIKDIQEKIDNLISDQDINEEVAKARYLDGKMDSLQKLVKKAGEADIQGRLAKAKDPEKTNFNNALEEAKKVEKKDGAYADDSTVSDLIKKLEDSINALDKTKAPVKAEVSKEALKKAIEDAKKLKDTDLYKNSDENKRKEFDEKLKEAETENTKQNSTDESVAKALQDLQNAQNALNGTFKLEKENGDALISVSDANDTEIKEDKDKEAIKAKVKGIPDGAVVTYSKIKDKKVTVTVVKDNVSKTIEVPVKGDVAAPTITVDGATPMGVNDYTVEVTKMENFPELTVTAKDDNLDESTLDVKPDVDWLEFDKNTKKIKLKAGEKSIPNTATNATISISVKDKAGNKTAKTIHVTVKSQADKYKPVAKDTVNNKNRGDKAGEAKNYVKLEGNNQFPANTTFKWKENNQTKDDIDLDTPGDSIEKTIEIIYPDGSGSSVKVKFNVAKTNLTEPTISEKDNGDIEIQAGPNATSLELTYTDKADKEKTVTLTKTGGAWTNLPAGFTANGDKITLSHESTKEGSTVKAKSKADNYNDSNEKTLTRTKTSPKNPATEVFVKGQVAEGQALSAEDKALVIASLKDENKNAGTPNIEDSAKIRTEDGKQVIDVTITHKDGSTSKISVPLKQDGTKPEITITYDTNNKLTKLDKTLPEIKIEASDTNSGINGDVEVTGLPDYLTYDKTTKTIKFANGKTEIPKNAQDFTINVKVKDKVGNEQTKELKVTVQNQSDKYSPETLTSDGSKIKKVQGEQSSDAKSYVKNAKDLPEQTKYSWKDENANPKFDQVGEVEKTITVTFPDGSEKEVKVKFNVVDTKPDAPTVTTLKNGDVVITPSADSDKVVVGYTPKDSDKETLVEVTKDKGKWKLPEGFKEENGKIIIPDEITQNNTAVRVKASKGTSDYTTEVKQDLTKKSLLAPVPVVISGSDAKDTVLTKENADLIKATLTNAQTGGATPSIKDGEKIKEDTDGSKYVEVTLTYDDQSTKVIKVPVIGDSTAPQVELSNDNQTVYKKEGFTEIKVNATDSNLADKPIEVKDLPNWLQYDETGKTIKFANGITEVPANATTTTVKVIAKDKVGNATTKEIVITVKSQSDKYSPETLTSDGKSPVRKYKGQKASNPETYVKDKEKLPSGTTYKWKNETGNPELDTLGEVEKEIEITYPDDSKETVKVKFKVVEEIKLTKKDDSPVLVNEKVEVGKQLQQEANKEKIKAKIEGILADSTVKFGAVKEEKGKKVVPVTVEKDGERKEISIEVKEDTTKPVVSIKNSDKDIITGETLPELKVEVTDENVDNDKVEVTVPSWLNYDKQTNTIKLNAGDKVPNTIADNDKKITVKATDKAGNVETKEITLTIKSQSEKYTPESRLNGSVKKVVGEATDKAENYIKDKDKLPTGTTFKWKENNADTLTLDKVGKDKEKEIEITYPDGSKTTVKVKFNVVDTKPSAPTVAVLKNGDVTITPSDDSDKVVVGYTPKDSDKEKLVEVTKDKGKWKLPEGFKEENGKIIIPDEITKNNTAVRVKASKGTSDYTAEVKQDLTKKSLLAPAPVVISGSDAKDTVLTGENKTLITGSLTDAQTGGAKASIADGEKIKEDTDGSKYVEVTLTYDDSSTKVIKVKVVGDSTGPVFEGLGDASVKKYETFKPIEIKATDAGSALRDNQPYEVENLPSWLEFDKATNKVKLANALTRVPKEATTVKFKVKAFDKFNNVTEQEVTVTVNEAEEFTFEKPVIIKGKDKDKERLSPEDEKTILDAVRGTNKLDGATPSIVDKTIKVSGDESSVDVTLTYDDNQTRVINVKVEQDAKLKFGLHLPSEKVEVNDINNLNQVEQAKVLEKVKLANSDLKEKDGYTYSIVAVTGQDKKAGTVIVSKDGKVVGELPGERLVKERDITKYDVALPKVKVQVENKTNLKADEKEKVKEALENATDAKGVSNKDKFPKGTTLEVQSDGTVIISYPDKTIKTISGSDLVDGPSPYVKTIAEEVTPKVPAEKVKVVNPSSLDDKEIAEVKEKIMEANKDTFPANTTVEVAKDGTATITYKDGSSDTIKNTDLVEKAKEKLTDAKQNPAVKPNAKVEVEDSKKLTDDEKAKVKENVKNTNPKAKDIVVGTDGTVEITYPDGSGNTIKPEDTVVQKAGKTPKESEAVKNPAKVPAVKVQVADTTKLTAEEIAKVKEEVTKVNPNATKVEVSSNGTATLTYKDGSENIVAGEKLVEQKAKGKTLAETVEILVPDVKTEVINPNRLSTAEKEKVKENLKAKNAGKLDSANITVQNNGTVTVEFADGSAKTIDGEKLVTKKADDGKLKPTIADLTDVDAPIYTKVAEYGKLTEIEKEAVKKAVIEANGGEDGKLKDADIKVLGDGTVVITYKDKSTDIIPADKTVNVGQSGSEALVQPALPEYPLDKLKPVADDFITEETQKIKDEINDSNIYSKEEKQKALAKIDEMVKKAKQKVQNAENDDKVLNTINEVLQDAKEFSKNIKENKLAEIAKAKAEAKAEIDKLANLTDEQKTGFKAEVDKAENLSDVKEVLDKAKAKDKEELAKAKAEAKAEIDKLANLTDEQKSGFKKEADKAKTKADVKEVLDKAKAKDKEELAKAKAEAKSQIDKLANLTDEQKSSFKKEADKAKTKADVKEVLDKAKAKDKEELAKAKAEAKSQIDKLANLTDEQKSGFKKDIQAGKDKNTVAKILDKAKEANKKVKGKAGAKEKAKGQSTLSKTGLNTTNTVGLGAIISLIALALRRKFKK